MIGSDSAELLDHARGFEKSGDLLRAYDVLVDGLEKYPDSLDLKHRAVLMLARAGATAHALREYARLGLDKVTDHEDVLALGGRILKDIALGSSGPERVRGAAASAAKYAQAYNLRHGAYPGINLATMLLLSGEYARARELAGEVLATMAQADDYYGKATAAEAHLLLGQTEQADRLLAEAIGREPDELAARASTLRQFEIICRALGVSLEWLDRHRPNAAVFYCGHMFPQVLPQTAPDLAALYDELQRAVAAVLLDLKPGAVFGALAAGADILVAEAALAQGAELHVVLPMLEADFIAQSVAPFGESWVARFEACRSRATTLRLATHERFLGDEKVFAYSSEIAMGLAVRQADTLRTHAKLLALWDGVPGTGVAGTYADVLRWRNTGRGEHIISMPAALRRTHTKTGQTSARQPAATSKRELKAMLFGDVRGFSKLEESHIQAFVAHIMAPLAAELKCLPIQPEEVATWGDGLYIVYNDVRGATLGARALLRKFAEFDLEASGLPDHLALRIGGHAGPVIPLLDPFMNTMNFFGTHVTMAARIEPVTMPGSLYVSEPFAAQLSLIASEEFQIDYVGQSELAKKFGRTRLFSIAER